MENQDQPNKLDITSILFFFFVCSILVISGAFMQAKIQERTISGQDWMLVRREYVEHCVYTPDYQPRFNASQFKLKTIEN